MLRHVSLANGKGQQVVPSSCTTRSSGSQARLTAATRLPARGGRATTTRTYAGIMDMLKPITSLGRVSGPLQRPIRLALVAAPLT